MNVGNTVFSQQMSLIPDYEFRKCVDRYRGDFHARRFTCRDQFLVMSYAQFTSSASLRSIEAQLTAFNSRSAMGTGPCHHSIILLLCMYHDAAEKMRAIRL
ncbi:DUF4372 domain-containing protein [Prevotella communis]|nr:DUF4372 domain-containing protein [Prevotella communis]